MRHFILILSLIAGPAAADFTGQIRVIDGDTFDVGQTRVRLFGIDAPELGQPCTDTRGQAFNCGAWVKSQVAGAYDRQTATCSEIEKDRYGRTVATCTVRGRDVGTEIVSAGLATAFMRYSDAYVPAEKGAAIAERGLWAFDMEDPSAYRNGPTTTVSASGCQIKGNISDNGRIYHMPHNRDYSRTRVNQSQGERWFCTETEAQSAGWRPARN